ncbi:thioredoxin [Caballeronia sp. J97]|uniref:thioredoxin n=1 Tax=Caballeronia sp. J97 TaxID=2805429 RepID=UPI002AB21248|nr:thioredoxin [Caballeronia sp. J97]
MIEQIKQVTDSSFEQDVIQSQNPVLVDFWAEWCGPCKMLSPVLDELATAYEGRVQIAKINVDKNQGMAMKLGVRGIPALFLFKDGKIVAQKSGALTKSQVTALIDGNL